MAQSIGLNRKRQVPAEDTPAFGAIAERFRRAGDLERAVALCQEGLVKFPDHLSARVTLGWSLLDLGRYDEARDALEAALKRAPDNLAAIRGLAELHDRAEHTMLVPMDGPGQWPPDPSAVDGLQFDPAAKSTPADVPLKPEPLSLDGLLSGAKPKVKAKSKKGKETSSDDLVDVVMPPASSESSAIPDLIQSTSHRSHKTGEPAADAVVPAPTSDAAAIDLNAVLGEVAQAEPDLETEDTGVDLSVDDADADLEKALQLAQAAAEQAAADAAATRKAAEEQSAAESRARKAAEDKAAEEMTARRAAEEKVAAEAAARKAAEDKAAAETAARKAAEQAAAEAAARHAAEQKAAAEAAAKRAAEEKAAAEAAAKEAARKAAEEQAAAVAAAKKAAEKAAAEVAAKRAAEQKAAAEEAAKRAAQEKAAAEAAAKKAAEERALQAAAREAAERAAEEARARKAAEEKAAAEASARKAAEDRAAAEAAAKKAAEERAAMEAERRRAAEEKAEAEAAARRAAEEKAETEAAARRAAKVAAAEAEARRAAEEQRAAAEAARSIEVRPVPGSGNVIHALNGNDIYNGSAAAAQPGAVLNLSTPDPGMSAGTRRGSVRRSLPELESLLRRVESRRAQLMTESVA